MELVPIFLFSDFNAESLNLFIKEKKQKIIYVKMKKVYCFAPEMHMKNVVIKIRCSEKNSSENRLQLIDSYGFDHI